MLPVVPRSKCLSINQARYQIATRTLQMLCIHEQKQFKLNMLMSMMNRKAVAKIMIVSILELGLARDAHDEQEPRLLGSTSVMRTLINMGTPGTSLCKFPTPSKILPLRKTT